jgi:peptidoglycan hydrolase-like protein with peptidoglycan-binding domain
VQVRRQVAIVAAVGAAFLLAGPATASSQSVAALQVALRARGLYVGQVDGVAGPLTRKAILTFQQRHAIPASGRVGNRTRRALGRLGAPLLGRRELGVGARLGRLRARVQARPLRAAAHLGRRTLHPDHRSCVADVPAC